MKKTKKQTKKAKRNEELKVSGKNLVVTVKKLINEGNVRHILIRNSKGKTIFELPLTAGVIGAAILPVLAGIGLVASLVGECTITVERTDK
jgi:hypothetical protein